MTDNISKNIIVNNNGQQSIESKEKNFDLITNEEKLLQLKKSLELKRKDLIDLMTEIQRKYENKEISTATYNSQNLDCQNQINICNIDIQSIENKIESKEAFCRRLEIVKEIMTLAQDQTISLSQKYNDKEELYSRLCQALKFEALNYLKHKINILRLKIQQIRFYGTNITEEQSMLLKEYTEQLYSLHDEEEAIRNVLSENTHGAVRDISLRAITSESGYRLTKLIFKEQLLNSAKKRTA